MVEDNRNQYQRKQQLVEESGEIKTALQVAIFGRQVQKGNTFYRIRTWLIYQPNQIHREVLKRYSQFFELHENLERLGFSFLPQLPKKRVNVFMSERDTIDRQEKLELYLRTVINRKDTRNSRLVVDFLNLYSACPEILYNVPQLIIKRDFQRDTVNCCLFLETHNLYVIATSDKSSKTSRFEIYAFRQTGLIQDRYKLKSSANGSRMSTIEQTD